MVTPTVATKGHNMYVEGKVVAITGAASGIGYAIATKFAEAGSRVVLLDIEHGALDTAVDQLRADGIDAHALRVDVRQADDFARAARWISDELGGTDILCNNAGVLAAPRPVWETPREDAEWVFSVNFWGAFNGVHAFVPRMIERGTPAYVVNTASMSAIVPMPISSSYAMSKSAVLALTEALNQDLRAIDAPIGVAVVLPEHFRTRLGSAHRNRSGADDPDKAWDPVFAPGEDPMEQGADPAILGRRIVDAVRTDSFWVLPPRTDPMAAPALDRLDAIADAFS